MDLDVFMARTGAARTVARELAIEVAKDRHDNNPTPAEYSKALSEVDVSLQEDWEFQPWLEPWCWHYSQPGQVLVSAKWSRRCIRCKRFIRRGNLAILYPANGTILHPLCDLVVHGMNQATAELILKRRRDEMKKMMKRA